MASTSALPQVSGKQNNPGRSLEFDSDLPLNCNKSRPLLSIGHKFPGKQDCPFLDICSYQDLESESFHVAQSWYIHFIHHDEEVQIAELECYSGELKLGKKKKLIFTLFLSPLLLPPSAAFQQKIKPLGK